MEAMMKTYTEMIKLETFIERFRYLKLEGSVGESLWGGTGRQLKIAFYNSALWKEVRQKVIARDLGNDLGISDQPVLDQIYVHHINPITEDDIIGRNVWKLFNPDNLVVVSNNTHQALHYGSEDMLNINEIIDRRSGDTTPWKK